MFVRNLRFLNVGDHFSYKDGEKYYPFLDGVYVTFNHRYDRDYVVRRLKHFVDKFEVVNIHTLIDDLLGGCDFVYACGSDIYDLDKFVVPSKKGLYGWRKGNFYDCFRIVEVNDNLIYIPMPIQLVFEEDPEKKDKHPLVKVTWQKDTDHERTSVSFDARTVEKIETREHVFISREGTKSAVTCKNVSIHFRNDEKSPSNKIEIFPAWSEPVVELINVLEE